MRKACHTQTSEKAQDTSSRVCCSVSRCVAVGRQKTLRVDCVEVHRSVLQCVAVKGHQTPGVKYLLLSIYTMITYIQYIHIYTYVYVYAYIYTYIYICICIYIYVYIYMYIYVYTHVFPIDDHDAIVSV